MDDTKLDQYDFVVNEDFDELIIKYKSLIGEFIMRFSELEHELNLVISELINDHSHDIGYMILENMNMRGKIDLFWKLQSVMENIVTNGVQSKYLYKNLILINQFRNRIAHANWYTIQADGSVRIKFFTKEGNLPGFKLEKITTNDINTNINIIDEISLDLGENYRT